jgi:tetratricopeptide (TPR) repeat protein
VLLIARSKQSAPIALLAFSTGFNLVAIFMAGTRSALLAILAMGLVLPLILLLYREHLAFATWSKACRALLFSVLLGTVLGLGSMPCGNAKILQEHGLPQGGLNALQRAFARSMSMAQPEEDSLRSFSARLVMWQATARMIAGHPLAGVGAGAWEVDLPLYQEPGSQLETDYYAHNEILQLLAEYGLLGWVFLLSLLAYLGKAAWQTLRDRSPEALAEAPLRVLTLTSLLMLLIVSNAGFAWRLASTGALFALALALLAASDARLNRGGFTGAMRLPLRPTHLKMGAVMMAICLALAVYITQQAAACESRIVRAVKLALTISLSGDPQNPKWDAAKLEMLTLIKQGIDINPHYRKLTPTVAEELARWGDWKNALWIWESLLSSRPHLVALVTNLARGYAELGQNDKAFDYLARAKKLQPGAAAVNSLEVILLSRTGQERQAYTQAKALIATGTYDYDLVNAGYFLAFWAKDWPMAIQSLELRNKGWPAQASDGWLKIGNLYASVPEIKDDTKALAAYRQALATEPPTGKPSLRSQIPAVYLSKVLQK